MPKQNYTPHPNSELTFTLTNCHLPMGHVTLLSTQRQSLLPLGKYPFRSLSLALFAPIPCFSSLLSCPLSPIFVCDFLSSVPQGKQFFYDKILIWGCLVPTLKSIHKFCFVFIELVYFLSLQASTSCKVQLISGFLMPSYFFF